MYEAMDSFLNVGTWHTNHAFDEGRFFVALHRIGKDPTFNADELGAYMREKKGISRDDGAKEYLNDAIDGWVSRAWAVRQYLEANHLL